MKRKNYRLGELFCGPGGIALGARDAEVYDPTSDTTFNISHLWASDYHSETCETYKHNFKDVNVICEDVKLLDIDSLGKIDGFAYGFPCNDFSLVGETKGFSGEFGGLYTYGIKVLNKYNPDFFIAENVGGLASANEGKAFKKIIQDLKNAGKKGYELTVHKYKFEEYGLPQKRHRLIIVGINKSLKTKFQVPAPTHVNDYTSVKEIFEECPISSNSPNHEYTAQSKTVVERLKYIKPGQNIWQTKLPKHLQLNVKGAKLSQIYRRLHPDEPSYTITGSGGGGTHGYHYSENRALTNRERARIQTFPDDFVFMGKKESVRRQIGMAVSPEMSKILFESILKTLAGIDYSSIPPRYM
ncbi:MAG: DNA cytosine methyltransferase [Gammaproteobacteria bacterium]|nr:DNA cytosine methyltransferase [Gammaproteobacteria bacterium]